MHASLLDLEIAATIRQRMVAHNWTLSTAESCTSGRIAASLTTVNGASDYFQGSMVCYQNPLKERLLNVRPETIKAHDVVSSEVVSEMAEGCLQLFGTTFCICSTGYTGSTGSENIPAGTVWIGFGCKEDIHTVCLHLDGDRESNTSLAAEKALRLFEEYLTKYTHVLG